MQATLLSLNDGAPKSCSDAHIRSSASPRLHDDKPSAPVRRRPQPAAGARRCRSSVLCLLACPRALRQRERTSRGSCCSVTGLDSQGPYPPRRPRWMLEHRGRLLASRPLDCCSPMSGHPSPRKVVVGRACVPLARRRLALSGTSLRDGPKSSLD